MHVNYYFFNTFVLKKACTQMCMHVFITLSENLVLICKQFNIYDKRSETRCTILKVPQTIRDESRWTASFSLAQFIRSQHWNWFLYTRWNLYPPFYQNAITPPPFFNVELNSGVCVSTMVISPQWSNTFDPDCRLLIKETK